jgi:hypothetical protein
MHENALGWLAEIVLGLVQGVIINELTISSYKYLTTTNKLGSKYSETQKDSDSTYVPWWTSSRPCRYICTA